MIEQIANIVIVFGTGIFLGFLVGYWRGEADTRARIASGFDAMLESGDILAFTRRGFFGNPTPEEQRAAFEQIKLEYEASKEPKN